MVPEQLLRTAERSEVAARPGHLRRLGPRQSDLMGPRLLGTADCLV